MSADPFNLFSFQGKMRTLHLAWMAFFLTFVVWFNAAPLLQAIAADLGVSSQEIVALVTVNVAIAVPARVIVGMLTDKYGPRLVYSLLLGLGALPCFWFAMADSLQEAALALWFGGEAGWRYAVAATGLLSLAFSFVFYALVRDTPKGSTYFRPRRVGAMEVTSVGDLYLLLLSKLPRVDLCLARACEARPSRRYGLLSEFLHDLEVPNASLLRAHEQRPLIEAHPLRFWQGLCALLLLLLILQALARALHS